MRIGFLLALALLTFISGCTQEEAPITTTTSTVVGPEIKVTDCVLSLCDCKCYEMGTSPEETDGKLCGVNCAQHFNVAGCRLMGDECIEVYGENPTTTYYVPQTREFAIDAFKYEFSPDAIEVNRGDTVILQITSRDTNYNFAVKEYYIQEKVYPHRTTNVKFVANESGNFTYYCPMPCGPGFRTMRGTLVVN